MKKFLVLTAVALLPFAALAQVNVEGQSDSTSLERFIVRVGDMVNLLIPIALSAALLFFFWGLALYILGSSDEEKRKEGKHIMIWGILALFVMVAVWGIVALLAQLLGVGTGGSVEPPTVDGYGGSYEGGSYEGGNPLEWEHILN